MESTDPAASAFNEATFKMKRLDELQTICNKSRAAPLVRDELNNSGILNHYNALVSLYQECSSKLKESEQKKVKPLLKELMPIVRTLNRKLPAKSKDIAKIKWYKSTEGTRLFDDVSDKLFEIEEQLRKFLDEKGFSTLNIESVEGDNYN